MAYVNTDGNDGMSTSGPDTFTRWIPVNRWSNSGNYSIIATVDGVATYTVEMTLEMLNRKTDAQIANAVVCPVENAVDLTVDGCLNITETPVEFFRIHQTLGAGSVDVHLMQSGNMS